VEQCLGVLDSWSLVKSLTGNVYATFLARTIQGHSQQSPQLHSPADWGQTFNISLNYCTSMFKNWNGCSVKFRSGPELSTFLTIVRLLLQATTHIFCFSSETQLIIFNFFQNDPISK
jgi:hypothetical protein